MAVAHSILTIVYHVLDDPTRARANLRRTLFNLKRTPVADWLVSDGELLTLDAEVLPSVDVVNFEKLLSRGLIEDLARLCTI